MSRKPPKRAASQRGASLIEVLVSMVILMIGLLGLIGVMIESQRAQLESYQRAQALLLVQDMTARINSNRLAADCYVLAQPLGTSNAVAPTDAGCAGTTAAAQKARAVQDMTEWEQLLLGSSEKSGVSSVGAMLGARGCVTKDAVTGVFLVSVAWQGAQTLAAPPAGLPCGTGSYGTESNRRAVGVTLLPPVAS
jgi:type IV pilus assembly protein PilV